MTRLERELLTRIKARLDALDPGAAKKLAALLPVRAPHSSVRSA